jgi:hypothetical protein
MSLFNPPNSPTVGLTYSFGANIWEWNGYAWLRAGSIATAAEESFEWVRPSDWLEMPAMNEGDQKFAGLYAIFKGASGFTGAKADSNFVALNMEGNYIVDWGNGVTQVFLEEIICFL